MEIGKIYNVTFSTGRYEVEYEKCVTCIKITPKSYRVKRVDGTTRLVGQDSILELKVVSLLSDIEARLK
jgi:ribosomal protein S26